MAQFGSQFVAALVRLAARAKGGRRSLVSGCQPVATRSTCTFDRRNRTRFGVGPTQPILPFGKLETSEQSGARLQQVEQAINHAPIVASLTAICLGATSASKYAPTGCNSVKARE